MKQFILVFSIVLSANMVFAQEKGIHFEHNLTWEQLKEKAKAENKFILVDCYATWCGPCKEMEQNVYPDSSVGAYVNSHFLSVKLQMDSTKKDETEVVAWRPFAKQIMQEDKINALPTYLFFSADGKLVHRYEGATRASFFLHNIKPAADPNTQEYTMLEKFKNENLDPKMIPTLILELRNNEIDEATANEVAKSYINNYLLKKPIKELTRGDIGVMSDYLQHMGPSGQSFHDSAFRFFYNNSELVDRLTKKGFADDVLTRVAFNGEVSAKLWAKKDIHQPITKNPDWTLISKTLLTHYSRLFTEKELFYGKEQWFSITQDWKGLVNTSVAKIERYGFDTAKSAATDYNDLFYDKFFNYSNNKSALQKAVAWQKMIIDAHPKDGGYLDTYANLLYKSGSRDKAIEIEQQAYEISNNADIKINLDKMRNGKPTWIVRPNLTK